MKKSSSLVLAAAILLTSMGATSASAQSAPHASPRAADILNDPAQQERLASTISAMMAALMKVNVGPLADVIGKADPNSRARDLPRDATLGDVMGRDEYDADRLGHQVQNSAAMVGAAASTIEAYLPVLKNIARDMAAQVEQNSRPPAK